jgi:hypothetical protein
MRTPNTMGQLLKPQLDLSDQRSLEKMNQLQSMNQVFLGQRKDMVGPMKMAVNGSMAPFQLRNQLQGQLRCENLNLITPNSWNALYNHAKNPEQQ